MTTPNKAAVALLAQHGRFPSGGAIPYQTVVEILASASQEPASAQGEVERLRAERDNAIQQAQQWKMEAQCHKTSLHEAYQHVTGATGEPGNWNGAKPIVEAIRAAHSGEVVALRKIERLCENPVIWDADFRIAVRELLKPLYLGAAPDAGLVEAQVEAAKHKVMHARDELNTAIETLIDAQVTLIQPPQSPDNEGKGRGKRFEECAGCSSQWCAVHKECVANPGGPDV